MLEKALHYMKRCLRSTFLFARSLRDEHILFCMRVYYFRRGNGPVAHLCYKLWQRHVLRQKGLRSRLSTHSNHVLLHATRPDHPAQISIVMGSRLKGNSNFQLPVFLTSLNETLKNHDNIEVLIGVDTDDDISGLTEIIKQFSRISIKLVGTPRGRGYFDLHMKYHVMLDYMAPTSKLMQIGSDDCYFNKSGWDESMLQAFKQFPDEICFMNLFLDRDLNSFSPLVASWWIFQRGPSSIYPTASIKILNAARDTAKNYKNYTAFGPSLMVDSFFEMLHIHLYKACTQDRMIRLPGIIRRNVERAEQSNEIKRKLQHRVVDGLMLYDEKLHPKHQRFLADIAKNLSKQLINSPIASNTAQKDMVA